VRSQARDRELREVASILRVSDRVAAALIAEKQLPSYIAPNPINRCPQTLVNPAAVEEFKATYASLHTLARQHKRSPGQFRMELDAAGIEPALDPALIGARFYKLTELAAHENSAPTIAEQQ
jgi:hypothetical protein